MRLYSAKELCELYPEKYIAVKVIEKGSMASDILKCQLLKVYNTIDDCKRSANELRFFQKLYKEQFDVIYGDYADFKCTRCVADVVNSYGFMAFEILRLMSDDSAIDEEK